MEDRPAAHSNKSSTGESTFICKGYAIREKCDECVCPNNVVLFKNCLSIGHQRRLMKECRHIMDIGTNKGLLHKSRATVTQTSSKKAIPVMFWNWPAVKDSLQYKDIYHPSKLLDLATMLFDRARDAVKAQENTTAVKQAHQKGLGIPAVYIPNALYGIMYPHGGSFIPHVDGAKAWALAISIGESAMFFTCDTEHGERTRIRLDSGDAVIFKGGVLYHGIEEILPATAPDFWYKEFTDISTHMSRFNLQFRDPVRDRLEYYPQFSDIAIPAKK